ncbi:MAG TPA: HAD-IC family P-type ATPase, partial [Gammaproteobacteria bacterium]|nr:HAD-IC family P-type ATPase [Gammaproteobacteria bacterium]
MIDKTGTLTLGKPVLNKIIPTSDFDENKILFLAASLESNSEHPLANAIVTAAEKQKIDLKTPSEFNAEIGQGITGIIDGVHVALGNTKLLHSLNIDSDVFTEQANQLRSDGETVMFAVYDNKVVGLLSISDPIKKTTPAALKALRKEGIRIVMVTGDNKITA